MSNFVGRPFNKVEHRENVRRYEIMSMVAPVYACIVGCLVMGIFMYFGYYDDPATDYALPTAQTALTEAGVIDAIPITTKDLPEDDSDIGQRLYDFLPLGGAMIVVWLFFNKLVNSGKL